MKRLLGHDSLTGVTEWFIADDSDSQFTIQTTQDVSGIVALNQAHMREFTSGRDRWGEDFDHKTKVASIPISVWADLRKKGITRDPEAFKRWLNDGDNAAFRTRPGQV